VDVVWFGDPTLAPDGVAGKVKIAGPYPILDTWMGQAVVRKANIDVFHFAANTGWARPAPVPTVLTIHDLIFMESGIHSRGLRQIVGHRYARFSTRRAAHQAAAIAVPTAATANEVVQALAPPASPVVIHWGVDLPPQTVSHKPDVAPSEQYLAAFSAQDPRKGTGVVVDAWRALGPDRPRLRLLGGAGVPRGLESRIAEDLRSGRIELLGYVPREKVVDVIAGALALIYPSTAEGFGFPVIEAMALGVPVVSGLAPATLELGGQALIRIDPGAPVTSIAEAVTRLRRDAPFRDRVSALGREIASQFSWAAAAEAYRALYVRAATTGPRQPVRP
jgi:glycosyltransferase involved in cell wall biosynthesis